MRCGEHPVEGEQSADRIHGVLIHGPVNAVSYVGPNADSRTFPGYGERPREVMAEDLGYEVADGERHFVGNAAIPGLLAQPILSKLPLTANEAFSDLGEYNTVTEDLHHV
jgi:hypothetical protein